ncbi:hypothetical protein [Streptomyces violascens]|uniref:hypothetical protein n=1 Tax=Streptomyces violascens TaxID=67381 RepID=UPI0036B82151
MTDKKPQPPQPQPPQLTEKQRVGQQVEATDMTYVASEALSALSPFGGTVRFFGKTDFEGHQLNQMIDLVENANPEHLASAGDALFAAQKAINDAASELDGHIGNVEWEGKSGDAFRTWGKKLVGHAQDLAKFADTAGVQISAAGEGLTFVRHAMPPRDHRAEPVKVADIPSAKRVAGNAEYEAAVKVEKDRQEAINQMNRLSSFYSVSEQTLAAQQPPVFEAMPPVGVPQPEFGQDNEPSPPGAGMPGHRSVETGATAYTTAGEPAPVRTHLETVTGPHHSVDIVGTPPVVAADRPVGTELNNATTLPTSNPNQVTPTLTPPVTATGTSGSPVPPFLGGLPKPAMDGQVRAFGTAKEFGTPAQPPATSAGTSSRGSVNPLGRTGAAAQNVAGEGTSAVGQSPMGRGISGGTPRVGGAGPSRAGAVPSGRGSGIVGGRPNTGASGSRGSKGTAAGGKGAAGADRSTSRLGQRGVIGAPKPASASASRTNGLPSDSRNGVIGRPQSCPTGVRRPGKGFTSGGSGLVRSQENQDGPEFGDDGMSQNPEQPFEGEEPQLPSRQSDVPPATN